MSRDLKTIFQDFNNLKVLIVGDVMIDAYIFGKVDRISPEAPVPVVAVNKQEKRLGGAANVALNIKALGAEPILCSVIGDDDDAMIIENILEEQGISGEGIFRSPERLTTVKTRVMGNNHQMLRIDSEMTSEITAEESKRLISIARTLVNKVDVVIFEDYDKGVLHEDTIREITELANKAGKPVIVDPKKKNFLAFRHCTLFKPNLKEIKEGLNITTDLSDLDNLREALLILRTRLDNKIAMVTMSESGVFITDYKEEYHIPAHIRNIADVSGAGDTVISVASLCLALGLPLRAVAEISNLAGGLVCEKVGVVPVEKELLFEETRNLEIDL